MNSLRTSAPSNLLRIKPKRIYFVKPLINKLASDNPPKCTYRTQRKTGVYKVYSGTWRVGTSQKDEGILIKFFASEQINVSKLTDEDALLAGVDSAEQLRKLFKKWYGKLPTVMWRNWFIILQK
jgi:hypothetical protein